MEDTSSHRIEEDDDPQKDLSNFQEKLEKIHFGPAWTQRHYRHEGRIFGPSKTDRQAPSPGRGDRKHYFNETDRMERKDRRPSFRTKEKGDVAWENKSWEPFQPIVDVSFYPEDKAFDLLVATLRDSCKTYELFQIAHLILEKTERLIAVIRRKPNTDGEITPLYLSLLDDIPFETEDEALNYILRYHLDEFFSIEEVEVEAPKGKFSCVHRCGITKKLLSAPNDHRYKDILREHFQNEIHGMDYEKFLSRIETTQEASDIQAWLEQMSHSRIYLPQEMPDAATEPIRLKTLNDVRQYCLQHFKERMIRSASSLRVAGDRLKHLPSKLRHSIEWALRQQRRFPLATANNLRNQLHRAHFNIYRKRNGNKFITFICSVKRKFRTGKEVIEPEVQAVIAWLETHPMSTRPELAAVENIPHAMQNLSWLIQAGLVTEFEDGRLFLPKVITGSKKEASSEVNASEGEEKIPDEVECKELNGDLDEVVGEDEDSVAKSCEVNPVPSVESTALTETSGQPMALVVPMEMETTLAIPLEIIDAKDSVEN